MSVIIDLFSVMTAVIVVINMVVSCPLAISWSLCLNLSLTSPRLCSWTVSQSAPKHHVRLSPACYISTQLVWTLTALVENTAHSCTSCNVAIAHAHIAVTLWKRYLMQPQFQKKTLQLEFGIHVPQGIIKEVKSLF